MRGYKFLLFAIITVLIVSSCSNKTDRVENENNESGTAVLTFNKLEHNFGKIAEGEKVACVFKFENGGDGDLLINSATTSCGCTVPRFDNKPIAPGMEGTVEVVFDSSHREGTQTKTITIRSNASVKVIVLRIVAEVITNQ